MRRPGLLLAATLLATGCTSFESDWKNAPTAVEDGVSGRWIGSWQNTNNTHGGALRAVVKPKGKDTYSARFHAEWGSHSGSFRTPLVGHFESGDFVFQGSRRIVGVKITTQGRVSTNRFEATYDSAFDRGSFSLGRQGEGNAER